MDKLSDLPNVGVVLEERLIQIGIRTPKELIRVGSREAFLRIKAIDEGACFHMLCALEGAVKNIRKYDLSQEEKKELSEFFKGLK